MSTNFDPPAANLFTSSYRFPFDRFKSLVGLYATFGAMVWLAPMIVSKIISTIVSLVLFAVLGAAGVDILHNDTASLIPTFIGVVVGSLVAIPTIPFYPAFFRCLDLEAQGLKAPVSQLFAWRGLVAPSIVAGILASLIMIVGYALCIVPGLLLMPISVMPYYFVSRGESGTAAISKSFNVLTTQPMTILYVWGFSSIFLIGLVACCIGVIVTMPMYLAAVYFMMRSITSAR